MVEKISAWLRPEGAFLATVGVDATEGTDPDRLASGHAMWWSHPDVSTFRRWIGDAGLTIDHEQFIPEGRSGHQLIVARADGKHHDA